MLHLKLFEMVDAPLKVLRCSSWEDSCSSFGRIRMLFTADVLQPLPVISSRRCVGKEDENGWNGNVRLLNEVPGASTLWIYMKVCTVNTQVCQSNKPTFKELLGGICNATLPGTSRLPLNSASNKEKASKHVWHWYTIKNKQDLN